MKIDWHPYPDCEVKPKRGHRYLVTSDPICVDPIVNIRTFTGKEWAPYQTEAVVLAWAELPEPYHPDGEDDESSD